MDEWKHTKIHESRPNADGTWTHTTIHESRPMTFGEIARIRHPTPGEIKADCHSARESYMSKIEHLWDEMIWELAMKHHMEDSEIQQIMDELE